MSVLPLTAIGSDAAAASPALRTKRFAMALLPLLLLLAWTAVVRAPFYGQSNGDEYFFAMIADDWRQGGLPYVTAFDIKPPGVFLVDAVVQALFGTSYSTFKGLEVAAVALGAFVLYRMLKANASQRMAAWAAALFPVYTLAFDGSAAINMLLQLPLVIAAFAAILDATRGKAAPQRRLRSAFLAGLAIGAAGMLKQTAIFEAVALGLALLIFLPRGSRLRAIALFALGAALPALAFAAYFAWQGHFGDMVRAVIVLAMQRVNDAVVASYGDRFAAYLTLPGAALNSALRSGVLMFLWCGAALSLLRLERIRAVVPARLLAISAIWLVFAFAGVVSGRLLVDYYLLAIVPPLLVLAAAFYCHGLDIVASRGIPALVALAVAATATFAFAERRTLFDFAKYRDEQSVAARMTAAIRALSPEAGDRLLVMNRGLPLYLETGLRPPVPVFHPTHLLAVFPTPIADPLGTALAARPRFIVMADASTRLQAELPERYAEAEAFLGEHYRLAARISGVKDSLNLYELVR
jgi:hypothetical protein